MATLLTRPEKIAEDHYLLRIKDEKASPVPGQFINIRTTQGTDPLLRRPFSIFDFNNGIMDIVIRVVGRGTEILSHAEEGVIDIVGPLGKGFTLVENKKVLLAGGGVGNAPLFYLLRKLKELGNETTFIYGARSDGLIYFEDKYRKYSDHFTMCTDDGSKGEKAFSCHIANQLIESNEYDIVYTCGPTVMMKVISEKSGAKVPVEVSVENYFGCGVGLCMGCTVETKTGFQRACMEGPVFNGNTILWDTMHD